MRTNLKARYALTVNTGRNLRAVFTARIYRRIFDTRTHGPNVRAVCTGVKNAPVYTGNTARVYGPYLRVVRIGLKIYNINSDVCGGVGLSVGLC